MTSCSKPHNKELRQVPTYLGKYLDTHVPTRARTYRPRWYVAPLRLPEPMDGRSAMMSFQGSHLKTHAVRNSGSTTHHDSYHANYSNWLCSQAPCKLPPRNWRVSHKIDCCFIVYSVNGPRGRPRAVWARLGKLPPCASQACLACHFQACGCNPTLPWSLSWRAKEGRRDPHDSRRRKAHVNPLVFPNIS